MRDWIGENNCYASNGNARTACSIICHRPSAMSAMTLRITSTHTTWNWMGNFQIKGDKDIWQSFTLISNSPPATTSTTAPPASGGGDTGVSGDPHVINMAGQKYDIQQVGMFELITLAADASSVPLLTVRGTVGHIAGNCTPTYVQSLSLLGTWVGEEKGAELGVRVEHWTP